MADVSYLVSRLLMISQVPTQTAAKTAVYASVLGDFKKGTLLLQYDRWKYFLERINADASCEQQHFFPWDFRNDSLKSRLSVLLEVKMQRRYCSIAERQG